VGAGLADGLVTGTGETLADGEVEAPVFNVLLVLVFNTRISATSAIKTIRMAATMIRGLGKFLISGSLDRSNAVSRT
jgi:hypothetical protein